MGETILNRCDNPAPSGNCEPTWQQVERAIPVMRNSGGTRGSGWQCSAYTAGGGVRTFVGSRGASVDATFSDHANDCSYNGFPSVLSYVMNLTAGRCSHANSVTIITIIIYIVMIT